MGLLDDIKNQVKKSGQSKSKILYFKEGVKVRIRFLQDMDGGMKIPFHDSYSLGINLPCQEVFGRDCDHCENDDLRHRDMYAWSVWDYEAKEEKVLLFAVNNCSPIPALVGMFDTYGTLMDRDFVITKSGKGQSTTYTVIPMDKVKFKNGQAKPFSESKLLSIIDKAFPDEAGEEEEEAPKKKGKGRKAPVEDDEEEEDEVPRKKGKGKKAPEPEEDEEEEEDEAEETDYEDMSAKELYQLCKERGLKVKPKMDEEYYIEKLEADDEEGEEDEW